MTHPIPSPTREEVERKAKSFEWQRSEFNADDREALDAARLLRSLLAAKEKAEAERDDLESELEDLRSEKEVWPEWANQILKMIRAESGYDGYDDGDGVDLPAELGDMIAEFRSVEKKAEADRDALRKERDEAVEERERYILESTAAMRARNEEIETLRKERDEWEKRAHEQASLVAEWIIKRDAAREERDEFRACLATTSGKLQAVLAQVAGLREALRASLTLPADDVAKVARPALAGTEETKG